MRIYYSGTVAYKVDAPEGLVDTGMVLQVMISYAHMNNSSARKRFEEHCSKRRQVNVGVLSKEE